MEMVLFTTRECNLHCRYCYTSGGSDGALSKSIGEQSVSWFIQQGIETPRDQMIAFYGGEPLLEYSLVRHLVRYAKKEAQKVNRNIRFGITTNGTLFSESNLKFFKKENVHPIVSIDGNQKSHDLLRKTITGKGSFALIEEKLPLLVHYRPASFIRMTINPETVGELSENVNFLLGYGLKNFAIAPNIETDWSHEHWETFESECRKIANIYLEKFFSRKKIWINFIDDNIKHLLSGKRPSAPCGAGKTLVGVDVKGGIYPCHRFISSFNFKGSFKLGDVWNGIDPSARLPFSRYTSQHFLGCYSPCEKCPARVICGGGCLSKGHEYHRNFLLPLKLEQYVYSIWADIVGEVLQYMQNQDASLVREIFKSTSKGPDSQERMLC
jgi:uncharacterized protein